MGRVHNDDTNGKKERTMTYGFEPRSLVGKAVVISGGTTGIGRATACRLVAAGANVLVFGRHETELQEALQDIRNAASGTAQGTAQGGTAQVHGLTADARNPEDIERVFQMADSQLGGVDILVNNAALGGQSVVDTDLSEIQKIVETNVLGYMHCAKQAIERMTARGEGHIVNIGSMSDTVRESGSDVYVATKSAINGFSEALRKQVNASGVKVSLIEPGLVGTDMTAEKTPPQEQPEKIEQMKMLRAEDIAECVHYTLIQPRRCDIVQVQIRPHRQEI
jgi:NADP-dependent 3-hydroxy acid dehydrogenase YdfG